MFSCALTGPVTVDVGVELPFAALNTLKYLPASVLVTVTEPAWPGIT